MALWVGRSGATICAIECEYLAILAKACTSMRDSRVIVTVTGWKSPVLWVDSCMYVLGGVTVGRAMEWSKGCSVGHSWVLPVSNFHHTQKTFPKYTILLKLPVITA
jgi:hypothetical protein